MYWHKIGETANLTACTLSTDTQERNLNIYFPAAMCLLIGNRGDWLHSFRLQFYTVSTQITQASAFWLAYYMQFSTIIAQTDSWSSQVEQHSRHPRDIGWQQETRTTNTAATSTVSAAGRRPRRTLEPRRSLIPKIQAAERRRCRPDRGGVGADRAEMASVQTEPPHRTSKSEPHVS